VIVREIANRNRRAINDLGGSILLPDILRGLLALNLLRIPSYQEMSSISRPHRPARDRGTNGSTTVDRAPTQTESLTASPPMLPNGRKPGILVADDEPALREILEVVLRQEGFTVWAAEDGREALALYQQHRGEIDLVILDVHMPELDGPHTLEELRQTDPEVRCCFMSGSGSNLYSLHQLRQMGACCFFRKPLDLPTLLALVRRQASLLASVRQPVPQFEQFS
jgi:CheY-like chemotaxis protein